MKQSITLPSLAGPSALLAAALMLPFWYIHLFAGTPSGLAPMQAALAQLKFDASAENPARWLLLLWAIAPIGWAVAGLVLLRTKSPSRATRRTLVACTASLAIASVALAGWETTILFAVPVWLSALRLGITSSAAV